MSILRRLRSERGIALPMALGVLFVLTVSTTSAIYYTSTNSRNAGYSQGKMTALALAEAGLNNAMAVLSLPTNNALKQETLPACTGNPPPAPQRDEYAGGYVLWCGDLDRAAAAWAVRTTGYVRNPNNATEIKRKLSAYVVVTPTVTQPLNSPAWNYIYSRRTGNTCDMTVNNTISGSSRLYVAGNLCVHNAATIVNGPLIVRGSLEITHKDAAVGASTSMSTRVETYVGGNCRRQAGAWSTPCSGDQDALKIFSKRNPPSYIVGVNNNAPLVAEPVADYDGWYANSIPGPAQSCTTVSGAVPTFDNNYPNRDNSVLTAFELTPASSYSCRVGRAEDPSGELSWNATTRTLTARGTIYIDGSVRATNGQLNTYNAQGSLYLSGTFLLDAGTKFCASSSGSNCDFSGWDPNTEMFTIVANGGDASGNGIVVNANSSFQGALFATQNVYLNNNVKVDGPIVGNTVIINNGVTTDAFPTITTVPVGMPGNPDVYAQPNPPQRFAG